MSDTGSNYVPPTSPPTAAAASPIETSAISITSPNKKNDSSSSNSNNTTDDRVNTINTNDDDESDRKLFCCITSSDTPGVHGIIYSYTLLTVGVVLSIILYKRTEYVDISVWLENCPTGYDASCKSSQAVLRVSFALVIIFVLQLILTTVKVTQFDKHWTLKFIAFIAILIGFFYAKPEVFDLNGYAWYARVSGFCFLVIQQAILLDFAYKWNETWLTYSEGYKGSDIKWKVGLLVISLLLICSSVSAIGVMYWQFRGCSSNTTIISLTLILTSLATIFQLFFTDQGSILTSAIITAYATYICYAAISLNPDFSCNPTLSNNYQSLSEAIGLTIMVISITWATNSTITNIPTKAGRLTFSDLENGSAFNSTDNQAGGSKMLKTILQEVSVVFILVSSYYSMVLTDWGTLQANNSISDGRTGASAMWIQASAQWIAVTMYIWSLVAPKLFPSRDFGNGH